MRLIDADRLMTKQMQSMYYHLPNGDIAIPIIDIEHAPTVEVPEIVRCKECKFWNNDGIITTCKKHIGNGYPDDWFCADGKKDESQIKRPKETFWDSMSEADLMEPMHHFED